MTCQPHPTLPGAGNNVRRSAELSPCGRYRYRLTRRWGADPALTFVMLNPSTADAVKDDRTIARCISFARSAGCGGLDVVNLMAWRATSPAALRATPDPIGSANDCWIQAVVEENHPSPVVLAWGAGAAADRVQSVLGLLTGRNLLCLGVTAAGHPRHPLYVKGSTRLRPYALPVNLTTDGLEQVQVLHPAQHPDSCRSRPTTVTEGRVQSFLLVGSPAQLVVQPETGRQARRAQVSTAVHSAIAASDVSQAMESAS